MKNKHILWFVVAAIFAAMLVYNIIAKHSAGVIVIDSVGIAASLLAAFTHLFSNKEE